MIIKPIEIKKEKKGAILDILVWIILSFIIILFFGVWIYGYNLITEQLTGIDANVLGNNISDIAQDTFGKINPIQTRSLHTLAFVMMFSMIISIFVTNFLVKSHPVFFIVYIFVIIAAVIVSVHISNEYESLLSNDVLGATLSEFSASNFIMMNLPLWVTIVGVFGAIFLFMGILRDSGVGGSVL